MVLNPAYGKVWKQVDESFIKMHPSVLKRIENPEYVDTLDGFFGILEAFGIYGSYPNTVSKILARTKQEIAKTTEFDEQTLIQAVNGLAAAPVWDPITQELKQIICKKLKHVDTTGWTFHDRMRFLSNYSACHPFKHDKEYADRVFTQVL